MSDDETPRGKATRLLERLEDPLPDAPSFEAAKHYTAIEHADATRALAWAVLALANEVRAAGDRIVDAVLIAGRGGR